MEANTIQSGDVEQVAKRLRVTLTPEQIQEVIDMYPEAQEQDPTGNWSEVVDFCIGQVVEIPTIKKDKTSGQKVKDYLVELAINDKLPLDMNDLSAETLTDVIWR
jgi:hypothetical protein